MNNYVVFRLCPQNHVCTKLCKEECGKCVVLVEKLLPCQHIARVQCHAIENPYLCTEIVEDVLLSCEHLVKRKCHQKVEEVCCTESCQKILSCGHMCTRLCHKDDPDHVEVCLITSMLCKQFFVESYVKISYRYYSRKFSISSLYGSTLYI